MKTLWDRRNDQRYFDPDTSAVGTPSCLIEDGYKRLIVNGGRIAAFEHAGYFNDIGAPARYEKAKEYLKVGSFYISA